MRAYLQLVRLPNLFTAMADIALGFLFTHETLQPWPVFALLLGASSLMYAAGMVLNDLFDREQDARERPFRPLPSGRVSVQAAGRLGFGMLAVGVVLGWIASGTAGDVRPALVATLLGAAVLAYDGVLKRTPLGPLAMGACRMLNVLLGMSAGGPWHAVNWVAAGGLGLYIVGVTIFARTEARPSGRQQLALGLIVSLAGIVLLASLPRWVTLREWPQIYVSANWNLFWGLMAALIGLRLLRAVVDPRPQYIQSAVRSAIFSLIILDAAVCLAAQDITRSAAILLLLVPTMILGRWVYST